MNYRRFCLICYFPVFYFHLENSRIKMICWNRLNQSDLPTLYYSVTLLFNCIGVEGLTKYTIFTTWQKLKKDDDIKPTYTSSYHEVICLQNFKLDGIKLKEQFPWTPSPPPFLAHLSRRLMGELIVYQLLRRPSVHLSTFSSIFSSETTGPIKLKFHMDTP